MRKFQSFLWRSFKWYGVQAWSGEAKLSQSAVVRFKTCGCVIVRGPWNRRFWSFINVRLKQCWVPNFEPLPQINLWFFGHPVAGAVWCERVYKGFGQTDFWVVARLLGQATPGFLCCRLVWFWWVTLWWTNILPWKITIFNGKIHYFYGHFQLLC